MEVPASKRCSDCKLDLPLTAFTYHAQTADRRYPYCRACSTERVRIWRKRNPERCKVNNQRSALVRKLRSVGLPVPPRSAAHV